VREEKKKTLTLWKLHFQAFVKGKTERSCKSVESYDHKGQHGEQCVKQRLAL